MEHLKESLSLTDFPASRLIQINSCGSDCITRHEYTVFRSKGRSDYQLIYIKSGWLMAEINGLRVRVNAGQCIVYYPGVPQLYTFSYEGNPVTYYIHFTGAAAEEALAYLEKREDMLYTITGRNDFEELFYQLIRIHNAKLPLYIPEENSILLRLITFLVQSSVSKKNPVRSDMMHATTYLREHLHEDIDLQAYAEKLHLSYSRFAHLFTETVGVSPHKYLLQARIDKAAELLLTSSMNINEIADSAGFHDPLYFSRLFRRYTGFSPSEYKNALSSQTNEI